MHLAFARLFADQGAESLGQVELEADNAFGMPGGHYLIHDLYPLTPEHGSDLFFTVENADNNEMLLTARLRIDSQELRISAEHLQSSQANQAMEMLRAALAEPDVQNHLSDRLMQVTQMHLALTLDRIGPDRSSLRATMLEELEKQFPGSDRGEIEALLDTIEERLGSSREDPKEA